MAFEVIIRGHSKETGACIYVSKGLNWWDEWELMRDNRFASVDRTLGYLDYEAKLSVEETKELANRYRPKKGSYWLEHEVFIREIKELDEILINAQRYYSHFIVRIAEWESGL